MNPLLIRLCGAYLDQGLVYWPLPGREAGFYPACRPLLSQPAAIFGERMDGLAAHAPRLECFFIVSGLAVVGLPATLGFCAEDLLLHGTLDAHPVIGFLLSAATALNAVRVPRFFQSALPREAPAACALNCRCPSQETHVEEAYPAVSFDGTKKPAGFVVTGSRTRATHSQAAGALELLAL